MAAGPKPRWTFRSRSLAGSVTAPGYGSASGISARRLLPEAMRGVRARCVAVLRRLPGAARPARSALVRTVWASPSPTGRVLSSLPSRAHRDGARGVRVRRAGARGGASAQVRRLAPGGRSARGVDGRHRPLLRRRRHLGSTRSRPPGGARVRPSAGARDRGRSLARPSWQRVACARGSDRPPGQADGRRTA